jgi:hypothetical protein
MRAMAFGGDGIAAFSDSWSLHIPYRTTGMCTVLSEGCCREKAPDDSKRTFVIEGKSAFCGNTVSVSPVGPQAGRTQVGVLMKGRDGKSAEDGKRE